eukprot:CAMPEP_0179844474 /NCGR_PEP_ID=MMETSP0982-20121206/4363_1 /TAXON_ID=483367 /ORGANISM="non described non described, Strain CCMP 2436" /LENGTH=134 /DNA_ID=CAMNT_0021729183 /DNA_START=257 /DNA_END=662 /DNA_ORIENTATION=+
MLKQDGCSRLPRSGSRERRVFLGSVVKKAVSNQRCAKVGDPVVKKVEAPQGVIRTQSLRKCHGTVIAHPVVEQREFRQRLVAIESVCQRCRAAIQNLVEAQVERNKRAGYVSKPGCKSRSPVIVNVVESQLEDF